MESPSANSSCLSLEELCLRNAIDNLDFIRDVGHTDARYLRIILPHCTAEQLLTIEEATRDRDLSQITNDLWLKCYTRKFGDDNVTTVMKRMKETKKNFKWKALYQAKLREQDEVHKEGVNRLRELYKEAGERKWNCLCERLVTLVQMDFTEKASRKLQQIDLVPPSSKKRHFGSGGSGASTARFAKGSSTPSNGRGRLMKKARQEYAASHGARMVAVANRKPVVPVRGTSYGVRR